jgi:hypothetical protein
MTPFATSQARAGFLNQPGFRSSAFVICNLSLVGLAKLIRGINQGINDSGLAD